MMNDLDDILKELGEFGKYQIYTYILLFFPLVLSSAASLTYVFSTQDLSYRCLVPQCEQNDSSTYNQPWLQYALPFKAGVLAGQCLRYKPMLNSSANCTKDSFSKETEECDRFIFETDENSMAKEFNLHCDENEWKRTLVGTLNNIAMFFGMPIAGMVSDRFGRKAMLISCMALSGLFGTIRSFTTNYVQFVIFEMLDAMSYAGVYSCIYVFGVEVIGSGKRGLGGAIISLYFSIGEILLGLVAWLTQDWRIYLRVIALPSFLFLSYYWILPESIRWLISHKKKEKVIESINRLSRWNGTKVTDNVKKAIENLCANGTDENQSPTEHHSLKSKSKLPLKNILKSRKIVLRVLNCSFCWITHTFVFYGLSLNSVTIAGNKFLNFILVSFVEMPGYILSGIMVNYLGRKLALFIGLAVSGVACVSFYFIPKDFLTTRLILYFTGKMAITESFGALYMVASEIYPTEVRHSLISFCSTLGRIGSMLAPQTPLLTKFIDPVLVFGTFSFVAAALSLCFPETRNCSMPETIKSAEHLGIKRNPAEQRREETS